MYAVVRDNTFDAGKLAQGGGDVAEFQKAHAAQPGYRGSIVVDAGAGRQITLTLWNSQEAAAARVALGPVIQRALAPHRHSELNRIVLRVWLKPDIPVDSSLGIEKKVDRLGRLVLERGTTVVRTIDRDVTLAEVFVREAVALCQQSSSNEPRPLKS